MKNIDATIIKELLSPLGDDVLKEVKDSGLQMSVEIQPAYLLEVSLLLKTHPSTYFDFLSSITAVHLEDNSFEVLYHLFSLPHQHQLTLRTKAISPVMGDELPFLSSVSSVWRTAEWHEREAFDLMGIYFENHPDLRRILMPDDWVGHPLRKDYVQMDTYHDMPTH